MADDINYFGKLGPEADVHWLCWSPQHRVVLRASLCGFCLAGKGIDPGWPPPMPPSCGSSTTSTALPHARLVLLQGRRSESMRTRPASWAVCSVGVHDACRIHDGQMSVGQLPGDVQAHSLLLDMHAAGASSSAGVAHAPRGCCSVTKCGNCAGSATGDGRVRHKHGGPGKESSRECRQMAYPWWGGAALVMYSDEGSDAAYVAGATYVGAGQAEVEGAAEVVRGQSYSRMLPCLATHTAAPSAVHP